MNWGCAYENTLSNDSFANSEMPWQPCLASSSIVRYSWTSRQPWTEDINTPWDVTTLRPCSVNSPVAQKAKHPNAWASCINNSHCIWSCSDKMHPYMHLSANLCVICSRKLLDRTSVTVQLTRVAHWHTCSSEVSGSSSRLPVLSTAQLTEAAETQEPVLSLLQVGACSCTSTYLADWLSWTSTQ